MARPITKANRKKVGFSLENTAVDTLSELSAMTGKSKSKIIEESIALYMRDKLSIDAKMKKIDELGDEAFASMDEIFGHNKMTPSNTTNFARALEN